MLIDWFTAGAQALNFLILVWLMKRFLYAPILQAIDTRERHIAAKVADADSKQDEARKERDLFRKKNEEFEQQRAGLLRDAAEEASTRRLQMIEAARNAADTLAAKRREMLETDFRDLEKEIKRRTGAEAISITRKALADLSGTTLEARTIEMFISRLRIMEHEDKQKFVENLKGTNRPIVIRSAFELAGVQRLAVQNALRELGGSGDRIAFETVPSLIGGIEVNLNGQKLGWSIAGYIGSLAKHIDELLNKNGCSGTDGMNATREANEFHG